MLNAVLANTLITQISSYWGDAAWQNVNWPLLLALTRKKGSILPTLVFTEGQASSQQKGQSFPCLVPAVLKIAAQHNRNKRNAEEAFNRVQYKQAFLYNCKVDVGYSKCLILKTVFPNEMHILHQAWETRGPRVKLGPSSASGWRSGARASTLLGNTGWYGLHWK